MGHGFHSYVSYVEKKEQVILPLTTTIAWNARREASRKFPGPLSSFRTRERCLDEVEGSGGGDLGMSELSEHGEKTLGL